MAEETGDVQVVTHVETTYWFCCLWWSEGPFSEKTMRAALEAFPERYRSADGWWEKTTTVTTTVRERLSEKEEGDG